MSCKPPSILEIHYTGAFVVRIRTLATPERTEHTPAMILLAAYTPV